MAKIDSKKIYNKEYFKGVSIDTKKLVYEAASRMAAGYLSFDSTMVAGTGGGPVSLVGRLATLHVAIPWICSLALLMAEHIGLEDAIVVEKKAIRQSKLAGSYNKGKSFTEDVSGLTLDEPTYSDGL